ncbi:MAG TPA: hypothetical protein VGI70_13280 [Polyangiales bacterium]
MRVRALTYLLGLAAISCTNDFSNFGFATSAPEPGRDSGAATSGATATTFDAAPAADSGGPDSAADSGGPETAADSGRSSGEQAGAGRATDAATKAPSDAPDAASEAGASRDADMSIDDDAGRNDAAPPTHVPTDAERCVIDWNDRMLLASCASCACGQCTSPALDCLARGSAGENALCGDLLACALTHHCHDWDCYCSSQGCRGDQTAGGPCVAEMEAAAGGGFDRVLAVHQANDPNQPLVRAVRAIGCTTGQSRSAVGGMMSGKCVDACTH